MELNESQHDALVEIMNVGVGRAAGFLQELVSARVRLSVPEVWILSVADAAANFGFASTDNCSVVSLRFRGTFRGNAALALPTSGAVDLAILANGGRLGEGNLDDLRAAVLEEIGNIVLNGVIGTFADLLGARLDYSVPEYFERPASELAGTVTNEGPQVLVSRAHFTIDGHAVEGDIVIFLELDSFARLRVAIDEMLERAGA
jgi:chemotaxis protein CheC